MNKTKIHIIKDVPLQSKLLIQANSSQFKPEISGVSPMLSNLLELCIPKIPQLSREESKSETEKSNSLNDLTVSNVSDALISCDPVGKVFETNYSRQVSENSNLFKLFKTKSTKMLSHSANLKEQKDRIILIVDDDSFNIYSLEMMLNSLKIKYEVAYNGKDAITKILLNRDISLVFIDCNMPLMDGWEATKILNEMMKRDEIDYIPIIACTAYCDEKNIQKCFDVGMKNVLIKPITKNELICVLKSN